jgi:hypothetical protein
VNEEVEVLLDVDVLESAPAMLNNFVSTLLILSDISDLDEFYDDVPGDVALLNT